MERSTLRRLLLEISAAYLVPCAMVGAYFTEAAFRPPRLHIDRSMEISARDLARRSGGKLQDVRVTAIDGASLQAWYVRPSGGNGDAVILLHGLADNRAGMLMYASLFLRHGYAVLAPDSRAHGESGGALATYGVVEAADTRAWAEWLAREQSAGQSKSAIHCVFGLGESMGAAVLLQALTDLSGICAVVAEDPFLSFREIAYDGLGDRFGVGPWLGRTVLRPIVEFGLLYAWLRYGINLNRASPQEAVGRNSVPILLIGDTRDTNVPPRHSEMLKARNPSAITLWEVWGADHTGALSARPAEFERRVLTWFSSALKSAEARNRN